jgi:hypothetical protein
MYVNIATTYPIAFLQKINCMLAASSLVLCKFFSQRLSWHRQPHYQFLGFYFNSMLMDILSRHFTTARVTRLGEFSPIE